MKGNCRKINGKDFIQTDCCIFIKFYQKTKKTEYVGCSQKSKTFTTKLAWYLNWIELHFPEEKKPMGKGETQKIFIQY